MIAVKTVAIVVCHSIQNHNKNKIEHDQDSSSNLTASINMMTTPTTGASTTLLFRNNNMTQQVVVDDDDDDSQQPYQIHYLQRQRPIPYNSTTTDNGNHYRSRPPTPTRTRTPKLDDEEDTHGFDLERPQVAATAAPLPTGPANPYGIMMMWNATPSMFLPAQQEEDDEDDLEFDERENLSIEAGTADEVSTLGDTMGGNSNVVKRDPRAVPLTPPSIIKAPSVHRNLPHEHHYQDYRNDSYYNTQKFETTNNHTKVLPPFRVETPKTTTNTDENSNIGKVIELVPTEDTSHETSAVGPVHSLGSISSLHPRFRFPIRRFIYLLGMLMGPVLLGVVVVLTFMFLRMQSNDQETISSSPVGDKDNVFYVTNMPTMMPTPFNDQSNNGGIAPTATTSTTSPPAPRPTAGIGAPPIVAPTRFPTDKPTEGMTATPTVGVTNSPTGSPTTPVTSNPTQFPMSGLVTASLTTTTRPPEPGFRFVSWEQFVASVDTMALSAVTTGLGYNETSWNVPGTLALEQSSYEAIIRNQGPYASFSLLTVGFNSPSQWNCWINHYRDFAWDELAYLLPFDSEVNGDDQQQEQQVARQEQAPTTSGGSEYGAQIQFAYETLGWNKASWGSTDTSRFPSSERMRWNKLSEQEQQAAEMLCYTKDLWERVPLPQW